MAQRKQLARAVGDYARGVFMESGHAVRHEHQDIGPAMRRARLIAEAEKAAKHNPMQRHYIGSVPAVVLTDWLKNNGYTHDQFARNEGGTKCPPGKDPVAHAKLDHGVRSQFLRYFLTRDFSKLHTQHTTTRREANSIVVPSDLRSNDEKLRKPEDGHREVVKPNGPDRRDR